MTSDALAPPLSSPRALPARALRLATAARREGPVLLAIAALAAGMAVVIPLTQLMQDSWLTFLSGREILHNGLHNTDSLTILTQGQSWIDQQWLAQVMYYGLWSAGGVKLAMIFHYVLLVGSFAMGLAVARRRGASPLAVGWIGALSILVAVWGWQLRSQNFAYPLFVGVLALLIFDRGMASRRVFLAIPLLVVWANLHGSVLIGVMLVCIYALFCAGGALRPANRARRMRTLAASGALSAGAVASVFASPYGLSLVGYYRSILGNDDIKLIMEWRPATEFGQSVLFYILLAVALYLVARYRKRLQPFEIVVLIVTAASGFQAVRNIIWFAYAVLLILPVALDGSRLMRPREGRAPRSPSILFAPLAIAVLVATAISAGSRSEAWYEHRWSPVALARVSAEARAHPGITIWATERFADWLMWKDPALKGHVAYDARLEMIEHHYFRQIARFKAAQGTNWHAIVDRYDLVVLGTDRDRKQIAALTARGAGPGTGRPKLYSDGFVTVLGRPASA